MKKIIIIISCMLIALNMLKAQAACSFIGSVSYSNSNCATSNVTVNLSLNYYATDPPGYSANTCSGGARINLYLEKLNGSTWQTESSLLSQLNPYYSTTAFQITTNGWYRVRATVANVGSYSSCSTCGSTVYTSSATLINLAATANFTINNTAVSATSPYEGYGHNCTPISLTFNNTSTGSTGNSPQYKLYFQECNSTGGGLTGLVHGQTSWVNGWPTSIDLKTFNSPNFQLGSAAAVGKYYRVTLEIKNSCNSSSSIKHGLVHINSAPSAPGGVLRVNRGDGTHCKSQNIGSPCLAGAYSGGMFLNSVTGTILFYSADIDEVNCSSGAFVANVNTPQTYFANSSLYANVGINYLSGNYFANNAGTIVGKCYKMEVWFGNSCNSATEWSYFKIDGAYKTGEIVSGIANSDADIEGLYATIAPNPANNLITLQLDSWKFQNAGISIFNIEGKEVMPVTNNINLVKGENNLNIDISVLNSGVYFVKVVSEQNQPKTIKFIKN